MVAPQVPQAKGVTAYLLPPSGGFYNSRRRTKALAAVHRRTLTRTGIILMEGSFGSRRRIRRPTINITSLIDVMFLLLIFFMVSSTFREHLGIDVALPEAATATEQKKPEYSITVGADGTVHFGEAVVTSPELRKSLVALMEKEPDATVVLRADKDAPFQDWIGVIDIAREVGGKQLTISTQPVASKP
jgi:biopolymer transport protein ExbD